MSLRILFIASAVGPLGAPATGGVSRFLGNSVKALEGQGHRIEILAPAGSAMEGLRVHGLEGRLQPSAASLDPGRDFVVPLEGVLAAMLRWAWERQANFDLVVNLNHDWLPYYLTGFFTTPLVHVANLAAAARATDAEIAATAARHPGRVAALTRTQARRLGLDDAVLVPFCMDFSAYRPGDGKGGYLAWAGRIAREKGLANAAEVAAGAGLPLHVAGSVEDEAYWREILERHGETVRYLGFLATSELQAMLGGAVALLQMQEWEEAFGGTTVEAMACATPVVAYRRGANVELVRDGITGYLVAPDDFGQAVAAVGRLDAIDRMACRRAAEAAFGLGRLTAAYGDWFRRLGFV